MLHIAFTELTVNAMLIHSVYFVLICKTSFSFKILTEFLGTEGYFVIELLNLSEV